MVPVTPEETGGERRLKPSETEREARERIEKSGQAERERQTSREIW